MEWKEENRSLLEQGIRDLPRHNAPAAVWNNLEIELFTVSEKDLPSHTPPYSTWQGIELGLAGFREKKSYPRKRRVWLIVLPLVIAAGVLLFLHRENRFVRDGLPVRVEEGNTHIPGKPVLETSPGWSRMKPVSVALIQRENPYPGEAGAAAFPPIISSGEGMHLRKGNAASFTAIFAHGPDAGSLEDRAGLVPVLMKNLPANKVYANSRYLFPEGDARLLANPDPDGKEEVYLSGKDKYETCPGFTRNSHSLAGFSAGYGFFPSGQEESGGSMEYWYELNAGYTYQKSRFYAGAGLGVIFSADESEGEYSYLKNELINSYEYVDSIYIDPVTGNVHYYTTNVNVYDSVLHEETVPISTSYTYLQLPVHAGINIWSPGKFSVGFTVGASFIAEMGRNEKVPAYDLSGARLLSEDRSRVKRNSFYIKAFAGPDLMWNISERMKVFLASRFSLFPEGVYAESAKGRSFSAGIHGGIRFRIP